MKKIVILGICSMLLFVSCGGDEELIVDEAEVVDEPEVVVELDEGEAKPLIEIRPEDTIRILVRADAKPGMWADEKGNVYGVYVDLERMVMERMNQKYEFVPYTDVGVGAQALKTGTSHSALAVPDVADYQVFLQLTNVYENINYITFVKKGTTNIGGNSRDEVIKSLFGKKVGVQVQGHVWQLLRDYKEIELIEYPTSTKALEALDKGLVDAAHEIREIADYYADLNDWDITAVGGVVLVYQNTTGYSRAYTPNIVERHNKALQELLDDGSLRALHEKYYGDAADDYTLIK